MSLLLGGIVIWSGSTLDIPSGWQLCDGTNGTPDLRNRFVVGAGGLYSVGNTGGSADAVTPSHTHSIISFSDNNHSHQAPSASNSSTLPSSDTSGSSTFRNTTQSEAGGSHTHDLTIDSVGESGTDKNLPPYFALCYIQQIS